MMYSCAITFLLLVVVIKITYSMDINVVYDSQTMSCTLSYMNVTVQCVVGKNGVTDSSLKIEGDGCTPSGTYSLRRGFYRKDRVSSNTIASLPTSIMPFNETLTNYGWCDDDSSDMYNQFIELPINDGVSYENLWLTSSVYDIVVVIGYNDDPPIAGKGSAIFFHVASDGYGPTSGCVAISIDDLSWVLSNMQADTQISISSTDVTK